MARGGILGEWGVLNFWVISRSVFIALLFFYIGTYVFMRFERKAVKYI
jgi:flagellar biogenesis protein FliO